MVISSPDGKWRVHQPSFSASLLRRRMFANVPRMSTSWFPRRVPYWLKSTGFTLFETRYWPAGLAAGMDPAGEMWSVVTESPTDTSTRAPTMSGIVAGGVGEKSWKNGGSCTYVELGSQAYDSPVGEGIVFQKRSPSKIFPYSVEYISCVIALATTSST